jgi:hypothetical protein
MQNILYEFLILNKTLSLPGVGTINLHRQSSRLDFGNKQITSPVYYFSIEPGNDTPSKKLFEWLSSSLDISEWDAIKSVNDFSFALKKKIADSGKMNWENIGIFSRDEKGDIKLDSPEVSLLSEQPVKAEKVIRDKFEHTVLVGTQEKSSVEMEEFLAESGTRRDYAWVIGLILTILALLFIGWHFSEKGFNPFSAGNQSVIKSN